MSDRFYQETPCEHGFTTSHDGYSSPPLEAGDWGAMAIDPLFKCPGGSRIELHPATPNYEAAGQRLAYSGTWPSLTDPERPPERRAESVATDIVDAALAGTVLLQKP